MRIHDCAFNKRSNLTSWCLNVTAANLSRADAVFHSFNLHIAIFAGKTRKVLTPSCYLGVPIHSIFTEKIKSWRTKSGCIALLAFFLFFNHIIFHFQVCEGDCCRKRACWRNSKSWMREFLVGYLPHKLLRTRTRLQGFIEVSSQALYP